MYAYITCPGLPAPRPFSPHTTHLITKPFYGPRAKKGAYVCAQIESLTSRVSLGTVAWEHANHLEFEQKTCKPSQPVSDTSPSLGQSKVT